MTAHRTADILRHLRKLTELHETEQLPDGELVRRFLVERDEAAFEALLRRHGAMVLGVCRRVLGNEQDAEDAFQATFLLLTRKAASLRSQSSVGPWLHGVAHRVALKARTRAGRRRFHEAQAGSSPRAGPDVLVEVTLREAEALLDEELARLPEKYRAPLVLCCLEGKSRTEAAGLLGWPVRLLKSRLAEARELLRRRLARRDLVLALPLLAALLARQSASAAVPPALAAAAARAATSTGVVPASVVALTEGVLQAMWISKTKLAAAFLLAVVLLGAGGLLAYRRLAAAKPKAAPGAALTAADPDMLRPDRGADQSASGPRWKRAVRWKLSFNTAGDDYARQLEALGAVIAIPEGEDDKHYRVFYNLSRRPVRGEVEDISRCDRLYWLDDRPASMAELSKAVGWKEVPKRMVVFLPRFVEDTLLRKEMAFANRKEEEIEETRFRIRHLASGYDIEVVSQSAREGPPPGEQAEGPGVSVVLRAGKETKYQKVASVLEALKKLQVTRVSLEASDPPGITALVRAPGKTEYVTVQKVFEALKAGGVQHIEFGVDP
jgi:RNA polymerase sigma factor (sigma-70 family)